MKHHFVSQRVNHPIMKELADRLRWARQTAGYKTASEFCRRHDYNRGTYGGYEAGTRGVPRDVAIKLSKLLRIDLEWLLTGRGVPRKGMDVSPASESVRWVPVISWTQAGQLGNEDMSAESDTYIPILSSATSPVALVVQGTSMNRYAPPKSYIVVDPDQTEAEDGWAVIALVDGQVTFKRYRCEAGPIRLEPDSTEPHDTIYPTGELRIAGRVVWVITPL